MRAPSVARRHIADSERRVAATALAFGMLLEVVEQRLGGRLVGGTAATTPGSRPRRGSRRVRWARRRRGSRRRGRSTRRGSRARGYRRPRRASRRIRRDERCDRAACRAARRRVCTDDGPVTKSRPSIFFTAVPRTFHRSRASTAGSAGIVPDSACPFVSSPNASDRPSGDTTRPFCATSPLRANLPSRRRPGRSASRAPSRPHGASCGAMRGVVSDPNVPMSNGVRSVSPITIVTDVSGTRSSSATVCESDVRMFCPISTLPVHAVTWPASSMCSHAARSGTSPLPRAPRPDSCAGQLRRGDEDEQPGAEDADEVAALELERVAAALRELVALDFDFYPGGFAPPVLPTRSLAGPPLLPAPLAWLIRVAHSRALVGSSPASHAGRRGRAYALGCQAERRARSADRSRSGRRCDRAAARTSSSDGFGLVRSRPTVAMIMPDVQ